MRLRFEASVKLGTGIMSLFAFEKIREVTPEQSDVISAIKMWLFDHPTVRVIARIDLIRDLYGVVKTEALQATLDALIIQGAVKERFRVFDPSSHTLLPQSYPDLDEIPPRIENQSSHWFDVSDELVATVLEAPDLIPGTFTD